MSKVSRHADEQYLAVLELWADGMSGPDIAHRFGKTRGFVVGIVDRVRKADVEHCGAGVRAAYDQGCAKVRA